MKTLLIAVSALALSTTAFAQTKPAKPATPAAAQTSAAEPATPATPAATPPADAAAPAAAPAPAAAAPATTTAAAPAAAPSDPKTLIASEFSAYDKDGNGTLDKTEFAAWMTALKSKTDAKPTPAAELAKWTDGAFASADKDKSKTITLVELQTYLTAGA